jgi:hypothetical protein
LPDVHDAEVLTGFAVAMMDQTEDRLSRLLTKADGLPVKVLAE